MIGDAYHAGLQLLVAVVVGDRVTVLGERLMRYPPVLASIAILFSASGLSAQVTEIPAMTQPLSYIDMDAAGATGPTTVAAIVAAGTSGGASLLSDIVLTGTGQAGGLYNTNTLLGNALTYDAATNGLALVAPQSSFDAFDAQIDLQLPMTEIGIAIGDWTLGMSLQFLDQGSVVGTITTSNYTAGTAKFFESTMPFRQVLVSTPSGAGSWVITELHIQNGFGTTATNTIIGSGCGGLLLAATTRPVIGTNWNFSIGGIPSAGSIGAEIYGLSDPNLSDLTNLGLPGCGLRASLDFLNAFVVAGSSHAYSLALPSNSSIVGLHVFASSAVFENPPSNPFGAITANAIDGLLGDL